MGYLEDPLLTMLTTQLNFPNSSSLLLDHQIQIFNAQDGNISISYQMSSPPVKLVKMDFPVTLLLIHL